MNVVARTFTKAKAEDLVPILEQIFRETRALVEEILERAQGTEEGEITLASNGSDRRMKVLSARLKAHLSLVRSLGVEVRRVDGLVDIPTLLDGQVGYLCWRYGDTSLGHWHCLYEDCAHRRPVGMAVAVGL